MSERLCVIALGGNLGPVPQTFRRALEALSRAGFRIRRVSSFRVTKAVDCEPGAPDFLNAAVSGWWSGEALELLALCQRIETENGRPRSHAYHVSRTLDLDLILFGDESIRTQRLFVPHPRAAERDFVMIPLREIEPELAARMTGARKFAPAMRESRLS